MKIGTRKDGNWEGRYISKYSDGSLEYDGEMAGGKLTGFGIYHWPSSNARYEGFFKDNLANGSGTIFFAKEDQKSNYSVYAINNCIWRYNFGNWDLVGEIANQTEGKCLAEERPH